MQPDSHPDTRDVQTHETCNQTHIQTHNEACNLNTHPDTCAQQAHHDSTPHRPTTHEQATHDNDVAKSRNLHHPPLV